MNKHPLLVFKKDRGKWIAGSPTPIEGCTCIKLVKGEHIIYLTLFSDWLEQHSTEDITTKVI